MAQKQCFRPLGLLVLLLSIYPHTAYPAARSVEARPDADGDQAGFIWPVRGSVISRFGSRRLSGWHRGVDIKAPQGTPIRAAAAGTVVFSGHQASYGRMCTIAHPNGLSTVYAPHTVNFVKTAHAV